MVSMPFIEGTPKVSIYRHPPGKPGSNFFLHGRNGGLTSNYEVIRNR